MRPIPPLLAALTAMSLLTSCTTTQVKGASGAVAEGVFGVVLDIALDGPERRAEARNRWEDNPANRWSACLSPCDIDRDKPTKAESEEAARRKRLAEAAEFEAGIDEVIHALDAAEQRSGAPASDTSPRDYQREKIERLRRRAETYEDWAEFDEFMRELDEAEEQLGDLPLLLVTR